MADIMKWQTIKTTFPDEWVAIADATGDRARPYGDIEGTLVAHHADERVFVQLVKQVATPDRLIDIRFTGELLPDNPVGPLLWQISPTAS